MTELVRCMENHGSGDWGAEWYCELEKGHTGPHQVTWDDDCYFYKDDYKKKDTYHVTLSWIVERGMKNENSY